MNRYHITDAASCAEAVKKINSKFYDLRSRRKENETLSIELRKYREASASLKHWEDGGERIDYKGWKEALKYLNQEHFVQDYELRQVKEEVCRMEVVKRKFIKENKQKKSDRYEHR